MANIPTIKLSPQDSAERAALEFAWLVTTDALLGLPKGTTQRRLRKKGIFYLFVRTSEGPTTEDTDDQS